MEKLDFILHITQLNLNINFVKQMDYILVLLGYLIGSVPTGWIIAKYVYQIDIKKEGSGNIGATNLTRVIGKRAGTYTLLGDGLKALIFMLILRYLIYKDWMTDENEAIWLFICGLAVLVGNCFSVFMKFNGGKGGTTTYGVFLALAPLPAITSIMIYAVALIFLRVSAIGTLSSTILLWVWIYSYYLPSFQKEYLIYLSLCFALVVWIRHIPNIRKMIKERL